MAGGFRSWPVVAVPDTCPRGPIPTRCASCVDAELARCRRSGVTDAELSRAKNLTAAGFWKKLATIDGKAQLLGEYEVFHGDWPKLFDAPAQFERVTRAEIHAVAREILDQAPPHGRRAVAGARSGGDHEEAERGRSMIGRFLLKMARRVPRCDTSRIAATAGESSRRRARPGARALRARQWHDAHRHAAPGRASGCIQRGAARRCSAVRPAKPVWPHWSRGCWRRARESAMRSRSRMQWKEWAAASVPRPAPNRSVSGASSWRATNS